MGLKQVGILAQLVEQLTLNQRVGGSNPSCPIHIKKVSKQLFGGLFCYIDFNFCLSILMKEKMIDRVALWYSMFLSTIYISKTIIKMLYMAII